MHPVNVRLKRCAVRRFLLVALPVLVVGGCGPRETASRDADPALTARIEQLVETVLASGDDAGGASAIAEAGDIFEREGVPSRARVGDAASYGFVMINVLGQPPDVGRRFIARVRDAAARHELPEDAVLFAEARLRQAEVEGRYRAQSPAHPELRDQIVQLVADDQAVRERQGFDRTRLAEQDRRTAGPLKAILDRYGVPTYDMVGVQAAKDFAVMVQHQPADFRLVVLPNLKANLDAGQADPAVYAMVYDRTQRDQGRNQLYGQQLECSPGRELELAPIDDPTNLNRRRAELGLMRIELYTRLVRMHSPDLCNAAGAEQ